MSNKVQKYDDVLLKHVIERDQAILIGEYNKLNRESKIKFKCNCGKEYDKNFRLMYENGGAYCNTCTNIKRADKIKKNTLEKYGVEFSFQRDEIKDKSKNTIKERYGVDYAAQIPGHKEKIKKTSIKKYGVEHPQQNNEIKQKVRKNNLDKYGVISTAMLDNVKEKAKKTNLERYGTEYTHQNEKVKAKGYATNLIKYGVINPFQSTICKDKSKETCLEKYGAIYAQQNEEVKAKVITTCIKKYGVKYALQNEEVKAKGVATNLIKYGVEHPQQNQEVMERIQKNAKKYKEFVMPSGIIRKVQGYEPFALKELLKIYKEEQIITERKDVPRIQYTVDKKKKYHFPDIFIPHENKLIEVKSTWTLKCKNDNIQLKKKASEEKEFLYEIWCFDGKGKRIEVLD